MKNILLLLTVCCLVWGCKKKDDTEPMPSPSQSGKNIIAYKADGKVRVYSGIPTYLNDDGVRLSSKLASGLDTFMMIQGDDAKDNLTLYIYELNPEINKEYRLSTENSKDYVRYYINPGNNNQTYKTKNNSGYIKFTRYDGRVVAGVFEFTVYNPDGAKVTITEGFFDIAVQ